MTLPDEYNRKFVDEFPEDQEASDDETDQVECNTASSTGSTNAINDSDPDSNQQLEEEKDNRRCYGNSRKSGFSCVLKSCTSLVYTAQPTQSFIVCINT